MNNHVKLNWCRVGEHALPVPTRANADDAGIDLAVTVDPAGYPKHPLPLDGRIGVAAGTTIVFGTGWRVAIPSGWCGLIMVRSSVGKAGWDLESSGLIDSSYRGEIAIPLIFRGDPLDPRRYVTHGDRMAQMLLLPAPPVASVEVSELDATARGAGGFGSTGR